MPNTKITSPRLRNRQESVWRYRLKSAEEQTRRLERELTQVIRFQAGLIMGAVSGRAEKLKAYEECAQMADEAADYWVAERIREAAQRHAPHAHIRARDGKQNG